MPFVATTVNVYGVPNTRSTIVSGEEPPVAVNPPDDDVTVYDTIVDPPSVTGAVKDTVACLRMVVAVPIVGAFGTVAGVTEFEGSDAIEFPLLFVATTVTV
jgi:hypothetical protein